MKNVTSFFGLITEKISEDFQKIDNIRELTTEEFTDHYLQIWKLIDSYGNRSSAPQDLVAYFKELNIDHKRRSDLYHNRNKPQIQ